MRGNAQPDGRTFPLVGSKLVSYFSPYVDQSSLKCGSDSSLQRRFPFDDILLHSGNSHDRVAKLTKFLCFGVPIF